jgi:hypothetical protein
MHRQIHFSFWNNLIGWSVFALSAIIYLSTLEPTLSFWDCGEFIACSYKLEVCHAPGNPFFLLIGRLASMFAFGDTSKVALAVNASSAICSAFTILFLFWTITWFCRKLLASNYQQSNSQKIIILASGFIGAMVYAVSDSFWFSAVEAEVYAMSSMFTALVFWCILKWEEAPAGSNSERWLLLIAYLFGLSIGIHLLNLLVIPAIVALYYFKNYKITWRNSLVALSIAIVILFILLNLIIPGIPSLFAHLELFTVNNMGLPYNSGYFIGLPILTIAVGASLYWSYRHKKIWIYRSILMIALIILGFSTYGIIVIRSHDNPPVDMNNPEDPFALTNYLNRENYGKRPLLYGPAFNSPIIGIDERSSYERANGKYIPMPLIPDYKYDPATMMIFPRMSSNDPDHEQAYKQWIHFDGKLYAYNLGNGHTQQILLPTFSDNLAFFFKYQLGFMYLRYFMWNFAGRQSDVQGHGNAMHGNWISGIHYIDRMRLGLQGKQPETTRNNPGHNVYFMLPLLLGLIGLCFHFRKDKRNFVVLLLFFFFTGIAVILYLNEVPYTPRERDYVHVGSFYVFAVWIGIGVMSLYQLISSKNYLRRIALPVSIAASLTVPSLMFAQNLDDHNRSHRYFALEYARNFLESCQPNAILFTSADNDTYPFWYAQEVEGIRRDIQIVLMPYLSADWYVNQMRQPAYNRQGLKMSIAQDKYSGGQRSALPIIDKIDTTVDACQMLNFVCSNDLRAKVEMQNGESSNFMPSHRIGIPVNQQALCDGDSLKHDDSINITLKGDYIYMDKLALIDIIASNQWLRPVYFTSPQGPANIGLDKYLKLDGLAYRLTPYITQAADYSLAGYINTGQLYQQLMKQFSWASLVDPRVYLDYTHIYTSNTAMLRCKYSRLAEALLNEGQKKQAIEVLDKISTMLPLPKIPLDYYNLIITELYLQAGEKAKGVALINILKKTSTENLNYYQSLSRTEKLTTDYDFRLNEYVRQSIELIEKEYKI